MFLVHHVDNEYIAFNTQDEALYFIMTEHQGLPREITHVYEVEQTNVYRPYVLPDTLEWGLINEKELDN